MFKQLTVVLSEYDRRFLLLCGRSAGGTVGGGAGVVGFGEVLADVGYEAFEPLAVDGVERAEDVGGCELAFDGHLG